MKRGMHTYDVHFTTENSVRDLQDFENPNKNQMRSRDLAQIGQDFRISKNGCQVFLAFQGLK